MLFKTSNGARQPAVSPTRSSIDMPLLKLHNSAPLSNRLQDKVLAVAGKYALPAAGATLAGPALSLLPLGPVGPVAGKSSCSLPSDTERALYVDSMTNYWTSRSCNRPRTVSHPPTQRRELLRSATFRWSAWLVGSSHLAVEYHGVGSCRRYVHSSTSSLRCCISEHRCRAVEAIRLMRKYRQHRRSSTIIPSNACDLTRRFPGASSRAIALAAHAPAERTALFVGQRAGRIYSIAK